MDVDPPPPLPPPPPPPPPPATPQQNTAVELPPGVYFNPTREEAMHHYLNRWIAGKTIPEMEAGFVAGADVYGDGPDALRRRHRPGYWCNYVYKWFFLCHRKRQSLRRTTGNKRAERVVAAGGRWKVEQGKKVLGGGGGGGERDSLGFYSSNSTKKTSWIMEEYTSSAADGAAAAEDRMEPVLCKIYLSPRAPAGEKRALFGEDGVAVGPDGRKRNARVAVLATLFDDVAALLGQPVAAAALPAPGDQLGHGHFDDVAARFGQVAVAALPASGDLGHGYFDDDAAALLGQVAMAPAPAPGHHQQGYVVAEAPLPESGYLGHYHHDGHLAQAAAAPEQDHYLGYHSHDAHVADGEATPEQGYHDDAHVAVAPAPEQGDLGHDQGHLAAALTPEECGEIVGAYEFHPEMVQMLSMGFAVPDEQLVPQLLDPTAGGYDMASSAIASVGDVKAYAAAAPTPRIRPNAAEAMAATATAETMPPPLDAVAAELSAPPRGLPPELAFSALPSVQQEPSCDGDDDSNFGELVAEVMPPLIGENADVDAGSDEPLPDLAGITPELDFGHDFFSNQHRE
uniref:NAC domain-containing protein n=1 Tax=Oryza glaberrima TaxID=4538 RepID=I1R4I2_ORYGL